MGLSRLQEKFPDILSFDGKGLMWALDFEDPEADKVGNVPGGFLWQTALSYIICGYLLNEKQMICMPFLGKTGALCFEPALTVDEHQVDTFLSAIKEG